MVKHLQQMRFQLPQRISFRVTWFGIAALLLIVGLPGCSGCFTDPNAENDPEKNREKLAKKKPKEDFEQPLLKVLPYDDQRNVNYVKTGHWVIASNRLKANNYDFRGELFSQTLDSNNRPTDLIGTDYQFASNRPIALPKGQERWADVTFYVPRVAGETESKKRNLSCILRSRGGGRDAALENQPTTRMQPFQYLLVVLASSADDYQFISALDSTKPLLSSMATATSSSHYRVTLPKVIDRVPLPENPLTWTNIAYILWDDIDPTVMTPDQQLAMIDWLHWGGQLIISGPASLDSLKISFLSDYLPAESEGNLDLTQEAFKTWNDEFSLSERLLENNRFVQRKFDLDVADGAVRGIKLKLAPEAEYVPNTGDLIVERRVGRGRICLTAFQLKDPRICKNWKHFDNFWNNAILRRPQRKFSKSVEDIVVSNWTSGLNQNDPRLITKLRFFSRDMQNEQATYQKADDVLLSKLTEEALPKKPDSETENLDSKKILPEGSADLHDVVEGQADPIKGKPFSFADFKKVKIDQGFDVDAESGIAGWNDHSGAAAAARECLQDAAGISIPDSQFILRTTALYLLVLVPLNWFVFWMIGRVEWAWIAAPVIAIVGALTVIKLAELDIGFARSRTEIGILEIQSDYSRAHMTRFTSLYTSLSTGYELEFDQTTALALPLARPRNQASPLQNRFSSSKSTAYFYQEGSKVSLSGFQVPSNSTGMVHSEYMLPLSPNAIFDWKKIDDTNFELTYGGDLTINDVGIIRRVGDRRNSKIEVAWVGTLEPTAKVKIQFQSVKDYWSLFDQWNESPVFSPDKSAAEVSLRHLLNTAKDPRNLTAGDVRLIGWTDQDVPGMVIYPAASQRTLRTLVLGNLKYAALPPPKSDFNTRRVDGEEPEKNQGLLLNEIENLKKPQ